MSSVLSWSACSTSCSFPHCRQPDDARRHLLATANGGPSRPACTQRGHASPQGDNYVPLLGLWMEIDIILGWHWISSHNLCFLYPQARLKVTWSAVGPTARLMHPYSSTALSETTRHARSFAHLSWEIQDEFQVCCCVRSYFCIGMSRTVAFKLGSQTCATLHILQIACEHVHFLHSPGEFTHSCS